MSVNNSSPALKNFNKLKFGKLLSFDFMFTLINVQNWSDVLLGFWVINDVFIEIDLAESSSDQIVDETFSLDLNFFQDFLIVNDALNDLELFPLDQNLAISQEQLSFSYFIVNIFLKIQKYGQHVSAEFQWNIIGFNSDDVSLHGTSEISIKQDFENFIIFLVGQNVVVRLFFTVKNIENIQTSSDLVDLVDLHG